jgi:hypothetical protein
MKDMDRMLSQKGALDALGAVLWTGEKTAKTAVAVISIKNLYDMGHRLFAAPVPPTQSSEGAERFVSGSNAMRATENRIIAQEGVDRFTSGGVATRATENAIDAQLAQESIDRFGAGSAALRTADNAIEAGIIAENTAKLGEGASDTLSKVAETIPGYTVSSGDNLTKIFSHELPALQGLTPSEQERVILGALRSMTPEQLVELGVKSGNADLIRPGETLNLDKFNEIVSTAKTGGGSGGGGFGALPPTGGGSGGGGGASTPQAFGYASESRLSGNSGTEDILGTSAEIQSMQQNGRMPEPPKQEILAEVNMSVKTVDSTQDGYANTQREAVSKLKAEDFKVEDLGTTQTRTEEQARYEYYLRDQAAQRTGQGVRPSDIQSSQSRSSNGQGYDPRSEQGDFNRPQIARVAETSPKQGGIFEKFSENPQMKALQAKQEMEDTRFESQWQKRMSDMEAQLQRRIQSLEQRKSMLSSQAEDRAIQGGIRTATQEAQRAIRGSSSNNLSSVLERALRGEAANYVGNKIRGIEQSSNIDADIARAKEEFSRRMQDLRLQESDARIQHEMRQLEAAQRLADQLERSRRI